MFIICSHASRGKRTHPVIKGVPHIKAMIIGLGMAASLSAQALANEFVLYQHATPGTEPELIAPPTALPPAASSPAPMLVRSDVSYRESLYARAVSDAERRYQLPAHLLRALIWAESRFDPMAISRAGAAGLAQLMPGTARELGIMNRHDPIASIDGGARYLRQMLDRFEAVHLALAAYNAGPGAVSKARGIPKNGETPEYVRAVLDRWRSIAALR
jgi:soluble lytic murein transglycosylase-like protein